MFTSELYQDRVLDHYQNPFHRGSCPGATHWHDGTNLPCGDQIHMELRIGGETIEDVYFRGEGCCVCQAAASLLAEHCQGMTLESVRSFGAGAMLSLFGAPLTFMRRNCCLLPWRVLQTAIACPSSGADEISVERSIERQSAAKKTVEASAC
jgi:nitrogen fixation NifU-like protein